MLSPFCLRLLPLAAALVSAGWQWDALAQNAPAASLTPSAAEVAGQRNAQLIPFEVRINNAPGGAWTLLELGGALHATPDAFEEWRVSRNTAVQGVPYRGQTWFPLSSVPGYASRIDFANQSIDLVFSPSAFAATRLSSDAAELPATTASTPALFVNFDANYNQSQYSGAVNVRDLGLLTELGFTSNAGVLTSGFVGRNLVSGDSNTPPTWRRLETTFTRDFPEQKVTLRLGDSSTRGSSSGRNVYFGGLQISRNFALAPGFLTQPVPIITGTSSAPSTVELYVNDALRQTSSVPTGPFAIDNFPLLTGSGQVRVVVRDVLGRETVVVQPFFSHGALLEAGLNDWSFELGAVRRNLGLDNADYGQRFGAGLWRYGLNKFSTLETSGQWGRDTQNMSLGINHALWGQSLGQISLAASHDRSAGTGREWSVGLENSNLRHSFSARVLGTSIGYRQLGQQSDTLPNKIEAAANYTYSSDPWGSFGIGFAKIKTFDRGNLNTYSANYSVRVGAQSSLTVSATRVTGPNSGTSVGASLTIPLGERIVSSSNINHRAGQTDAYTSVSRGLPGDTGVGWRVLAGSRHINGSGKGYGEAGVYYQGSKALLTADAGASAGQQSIRLGAQGAVVWVDGKVFASRRIQDSFALVEVPGYADVGVGFQSSTQVRTDAAGYALLPRLQPYQRNSIRLDASELPINAELDNLELIVVPAARSGVKVTFPVRSGQAALIKIVMQDQQVAPAGAEIELVGDTKEFFVARRGEAFITGLQTHNTLRLKYNDDVCTVQVDMPAAKPDEIVRLGPLVCKGVKP